MTRLIMRRGPQPGKIFDLDGEIVTVGSGMKNGIVIQDNDVSREHCRLIRVMADYELHDLNSSRGTFVSGQRIKTGRCVARFWHAFLVSKNAAKSQNLAVKPLFPIVNNR